MPPLSDWGGGSRLELVQALERERARRGGVHVRIRFYPQFSLDLNNLDSQGNVAGWLDTRPRNYGIVGGYEGSPVELVQSDYLRQFDGLVFVEVTSMTEPLGA